MKTVGEVVAEEKERKSKERDFVSWNEEMVQKYDPESYHLHSGLAIRLIETLRVDAIKAAIQSQPHDRILEVGVGAGNVLEKIEQGRLTGIDISETVLAKAKRRLKNCQAELIKGNAQALPFSDGVFNKVICTEVLEHVEDPRKVIEEMRRIAETGAVIVVSIPNEGLINRLKKLLFTLRLNALLSGKGYTVPNRMDDEWHLHSFDINLLRETLQGKLSIVKVKAIPSALLPLRYVVICTPIEEVS
jgi:ubiquinone/menaquinone biosynthesis C-methylase UbiE